MAELDEMVSYVAQYWLGANGGSSQFQFQNDNGFLPDRDIPDPGLVALGAKFATLEDFAEKCLKPRFK